MAGESVGPLQRAEIGLEYVWLDGAAGAEQDLSSGLSDEGREALRAAVAGAILRSPWPIRGMELAWLRAVADMGMPLFARAARRPVTDAVAWEADERADIPVAADRALRPWVASLLGIEDEEYPCPLPQPDGTERRLLARRDPATGRWTAEMHAFHLDPDQLIALADASDDPLVQALLTLLRAEAAAGERARELLAADLSFLRAGPSSLGFTIETAGRAVALLAGQMATWLREHEAENYTETEFSHYETPYTVTVQRRNGRTPHQIRQAAEARVAVLEAELRDARNPAAGAVAHVGAPPPQS